MMLLIPKPSMSFFVLHDSVTATCMAITYNVTLYSLSKSKVKKSKKLK